jgi:hypothetical protein
MSKNFIISILIISIFGSFFIWHFFRENRQLKDLPMVENTQSTATRSFIMKEDSGDGYREYGVFSRKGNDIYVYDGRFQTKQKIENADAETFEPLSCPYARDKHRVYFGNQIIEGADPATIKTFGDCSNGIFYIYDDTAAFFEGKKIEGADAGTFQIPDDYYAKDEKNVYFEGRTVVGADPKTIQVLVAEYRGVVYAKDSRAAYYLGMEIPYSLGESFQLGFGKLHGQLFHSEAHDAKNVYWRGARFDDIATALILEEGRVPKGAVRRGNFIEYQNSVYCLTSMAGEPYGLQMQSIDSSVFLKTAQDLGGDYLKDNQNVYLNCLILDGADPETFQIMSLEQHTSKDKSNSWHFNVREK